MVSQNVGTAKALPFQPCGSIFSCLLNENIFFVFSGMNKKFLDTVGNQLYLPSNFYNATTHKLIHRQPMTFRNIN